TWIRPDETQSPEKPDRLNAAVGFFGTVDPRRRADCSYVLAAHVSRLDNAHQAIWCDLDEISSVDALIAMLLEEFRRFDKELPQLAIPPSVLGEAAGRRACCNWIRMAMRRGRYIVVIDSTGIFGRTST